jgi:hypothetical protein
VYELPYEVIASGCVQDGVNGGYAVEVTDDSVMFWIPGCCDCACPGTAIPTIDIVDSSRLAIPITARFLMGCSPRQ